MLIYFCSMNWGSWNKCQAGKWERSPGARLRALLAGESPPGLLLTCAERSSEVTVEEATWLGSRGNKSLAFSLHSWNMYFPSWGIFSCIEEFSSLLRSVSCGLWGFLSQCFSGSALFSSSFDVEIATDPNGSKCGTLWCHASGRP